MPLAIAGTARAATAYTWTAGEGEWTDNGKWSPAGVPGSADTATISAGANVDLNGPQTVAGLILETGAGTGKTITVHNTGAGGLTVNGGTMAVAANLISNGTGATQAYQFVMDAPLKLSADIKNGTSSLKLIKLNGTADSSFAFNGTVDLSGLTTTGNKVFSLVESAGDVTFAGKITGSLSGIVDQMWVRPTTATVTLSGANDFSGANVYIYPVANTTGALLLGNNSALGNSGNKLCLGSSDAGAGSTLYGQALIDRAGVTIANPVAFRNWFNATIGGSNSSGLSEWSGNITLQRLAANPTAILPVSFTATEAEGKVKFSGTISDLAGATAALPIKKTGAGTVIFTGANTYSGGTTIASGTFLANNASGSATGVGAVAVNALAVLGGSGTVKPGGANGITVSGIVAPGDGVGALTFNLGSTTGAVTLASGSTLLYEAGDTLKFTSFGEGDLILNNNVINFAGSLADGRYHLMQFYTDDGVTLSNTGKPMSGLVVGSGLPVGATATIDYTPVGGIDLVVVVPEPAAIGVVGALGLLLRRRRTCL